MALFVTALAAAAIAATAAAPQTETSATLSFTFRLGIINFDEPCPADAPTPSHCYPEDGTAVVRGLGKVDVDAHHVADMRDGSCAHGSVHGTLSTPRGVLNFTGTARGCVTEVWAYGDYDIAVTGGSGYSGVTGSGTISNGGSYRVSGTLAGPSPIFDLAPPRIVGPRNLVVRTSSRHGVNVRYRVTARDDVDGRRPTSCHPGSGTHFRLGRTKVNCRASDLSANTAVRSFFILVKRR